MPRLCVISSFPPSKNGLAVYTYNLCKALIGLDPDLKVLVVADSARLDVKDFKGRLVTIEAIDSRSVFYPFRVFKVVANFKPNIVHCHHEFWLYGRGLRSFSFIMLLSLLKVLRCGIVTTLHGLLIRAAFTPRYLRERKQSSRLYLIKKFSYFAFIRLLCALSSSIIVHMDAAKNELVRAYGCDEKKIVVIPHGIDTQTEILGVKKEETRKRLNLPSNGTILLCFGEIRRDKGYEYAIMALAKLIEDGHNAYLLVAGPYIPQRSPESAHYLQELLMLAKQLRVYERIILKVGFVDEDKVSELFRMADVVLLPYTDYGILRAAGPLYRALAYDSKIVAFNIPMFKSRHAVCLLAELKDVDGLVQKINSALNNYVKRRKTNPMTWEEVARALLRIYRTCNA